ncbi:MAG: hypothetical protein AB2689_11125 [Candidatus Thiodiazotropha taylori]|nr:hypothetical protein [Candidatus Thiodiazotropha taylori]MCW4316763.1 hypothetical protein [Candidatus Thiodiazotropha taylori]
MKKVKFQEKMVNIDLAHVVNVTGIDKNALAAHVNKDRRTIENWMKRGKVTQHDFDLIVEFVKRHSRHWLWRFDVESTSNWVLTQAITLLREAVIAEDEDRENKFGLVIAICELSVHPLTGEPIEHTVSERMLITVLKSRALYFSQTRTIEGEELYLSLSEEADSILDAFNNESASGQQVSQMYVRAAVEAKLGQTVMHAQSEQISYETIRDTLRFLIGIVEGIKDSTGSYCYPELLAKLYWNEANCHCENAIDTVKYADLPIQGLLRLHDKRLVLGLINSDQTVKKVLNNSLIAEMLGLESSVA